MGEVEQHQHSTPAREWGMGFYAGLLNSIFARLATVLFHPLIVLPLFVATVTESTYAVAFVPVVLAIGYLLSIPLGQHLATGPNRTFWLIGTNVLRFVTVAMLAFIVARGDTLAPNRVVTALLIGLAAFSVAHGLSSTLRAAAVRVIVPNRHHAAYSRIRWLALGLVSLVGTVVVARLLSDDGPRFPNNFALLLLIAAVSLAIAVFFLFRLQSDVPTTATHSSRIGAGWASASFRRYAVFRLIIGATTLADPFIVIYAAQQLSANAMTIGWLLAFWVLGGFVSRPLWSGAAQRTGARTAFQLIAVSRLFVAVIALAVPLLIETDFWVDRVSRDQAAALAFGATFFFVGAAHAGLRVLVPDYLAQLAPNDNPERYLPAARVVAMVAALSPLLGAWIIERTGEYRDAFLVAGGLSLLAVLFSGLLTQSIIRPRPVAGAWRLRRRSEPTSSGTTEQFNTQ